MEYKVGDRVRIKSLDWYNENKDEFGEINYKRCAFTNSMAPYCDSILTIVDKTKDYYWVDENMFIWTDEMIEGLVEDEEIEFTEDDKYWCDIMSESDPTTYVLPQGYQFVDENGNEILTSKIILEKINTLKIQSDNMETETHRGYYTTEPETTNESKKVAWFTFWGNDFADKVELDLSNRELIQEDGKWFVVKKKKEYPKTYEECCKVLGYSGNYNMILTTDVDNKLFDALYRLKVCRDAYWKIAGEEMGLGKPWEPDWTNYNDYKFVIGVFENEIIKCYNTLAQYVLAFPTEEMRDEFYENFKEEIESVKGLL